MNKNNRLSSSHLFSNLEVIQLSCCLQFTDISHLPPFQGSAWRGVLGWQIKTLVCPFNKNTSCPKCLIRDHCPYFLLFEKSNPCPGGGDSPRGYIFQSQESGLQSQLDITLFGTCAMFTPVVIQALKRSQKIGIGARRLPFSIKEIRHDGQIITAEDAVHVQSTTWHQWMENTHTPSSEYAFATPVRLRKNGHYLNPIDWPFFFASLARRLEGISCAFCGGNPLGKETWMALQEKFQDYGTITDSFVWQDMNRYSNHQHCKVPLGGLVGPFCTSDAAPWVAEWLHAARLIHVGKGAVMGLGRIEPRQAK
ncbi:MAG: CRISPR system precrRNA processing endoribonuclease RAMP protein Cas6 [Desulfoplanes sp.]|nr:CRISPR system precrRNA processing endoribonuclease RAMP protein Cas6 [Desulfoplanes sp.]